VPAQTSRFGSELEQKGLTMNKKAIISDQLYNWSDNECFRFPSWRADSATPGLSQAAETARTLYSAGFVDRTLQTLWQTGLQVRLGSRARAQVLSIGQPTRHTATDGLCSGGVLSTGHRVPAQLSASPSTAGADLQPQSRVITAPDEVLNFKQAWSLQHLGWIWIWSGCSSPIFCKAGCKPT
jgi:hypothetical protein